MVYFKFKRSKIGHMHRKSQEGMASIVVVSILVIVVTLISIGFARLMSRTLSNATNRQFSAAATYATQSAINDVAGYLRQKDPATGALLHPYASSANCNGASTLIGNAQTPGPFYNDSNLAKDNPASTHYTCLILDPTPTDLAYQQISSNKSQVVKVTTSAFSGSFDKLMLSWQPSNPSVTGYPPNSPSFTDITSWTSSANNFIPMLRVSIYPIPTTGDLTNLQANSKTLFLYPQNSGGSGTIPHPSYASLADGSVLPVSCTTTVGTTSGVVDFNGVPNNKSDYTCNLIIKDLSTSISPNTLDYVYMKVTPIYNQADVKIRANDIWTQTLKFINVQAVIDATAQSGGVAKRLQARVDTSSLSSTGGGIDTNISSSSDSIPEQSVRTANALCKRVVQTVSFYSYVSFDTPPNVCHDAGACAGSGCVSDPVPSLDLTITGNTGPANETPLFPAIANNGTAKHYNESTPDATHKGTTYIDSGNNVTLKWTTADATSCTASGGMPGWASPPDKTTVMDFTGNPALNGTGRPQTFGPISSVTSFSMLCSRVGGGNTPYSTINNAGGTQTVTAWPTPAASISGPASISADAPYVVSWSANNASRCDLTGNWTSTTSYNNPSGAPIATQNQTMSIGPQDDSTKTFTVECFDPIGRSSGPQTIVFSRGGPRPILPPACTASVSASDNQDAAVNYSWSGACPALGNVNLGTYSVTSSTDGGFSSTSRTGSGTTPGLRTSQFCLTLTDSLTPWGALASNQACATPYAPGQNGNASCSANVSAYDNRNGSGGFSWSGSCPPANSGRGYYLLHDCSGVNCGSIGSGGWVGSSGSVGLGVGNYCVQFSSGADPWGFLAGASQCFTIHPPIRENSFNRGAIWDEGPNQCPSSTGYYNLWYCRNSATYNPGPCADGIHRWIVCGGDGSYSISVSGGGVDDSGSTSCHVDTQYGSNFRTGLSGSWGSGTGWVGAWSPGFFLTCTNPYVNEFDDSRLP